MGKTQALIKETFDEYFDRLKEMAELVEHLKSISKDVHDRNVQSEIQSTIDELEKEIKIYAHDLKIGGTELSRRVA